MAQEATDDVRLQKFPIKIKPNHIFDIGNIAGFFMNKREREKVSSFLIISIIVLGLLGFLINFIEKNKFYIFLIFLLFISIFCFRFVLEIFKESRESAAKERAKTSLKKKAFDIVTLHLDTLARNRMKTVWQDEYGNNQYEKYLKAISYFLDTTVKPKLDNEESTVYLSKEHEIKKMIIQRVEEFLNQTPQYQEFDDRMEWRDYEIYCAKQIELSGWSTRVTPKGADQGVDIIAELNGIKLVVQCKLYSSPVGNKAVQEIAAGRSHENAAFAAVVSNKGFTKSAKALASTNSIHLLHHTQLPTLNAILNLDSGSLASSPSHITSIIPQVDSTSSSQINETEKTKIIAQNDQIKKAPTKGLLKGLGVIVAASCLVWFGRHRLLSQENTFARTDSVALGQVNAVASQTANTTSQREIENREKTITRQGSNIRETPNSNARVLRTVNSGTTLSVFERSNGWVRVGDADPWGWIHSSLLDQAR